MKPSVVVILSGLGVAPTGVATMAASRGGCARFLRLQLPAAAFARDPTVVAPKLHVVFEKRPFAYFQYNGHLAWVHAVEAVTITSAHLTSFSASSADK
jgi:hypothetical protein